MDPSKMATEVARIVTMWNQSTAPDRADAVCGNLLGYFESGPTKQHFQPEFWRYRDRPASVIMKALTVGVKLPEFVQRVVSMLDPDMVSNVQYSMQPISGIRWK